VGIEDIDWLSFYFHPKKIGKGWPGPGHPFVGISLDIAIGVDAEPIIRRGVILSVSIG
jgi:hypothetical protein